MRAMAMGLVFLGVFHLFLVTGMIGDAIIIGSFLSGISILSGIGFWFAADEIKHIKKG